MRNYLVLSRTYNDFTDARSRYSNFSCSAWLYQCSADVRWVPAGSARLVCGGPQ